jgi:hypothetical protein
MRLRLALASCLLLLCPAVALADGDTISGSLLGELRPGKPSQHLLRIPPGATRALVVVAAEFDATLTYLENGEELGHDDDSGGHLMPALEIVNSEDDTAPLTGTTLTFAVGAFDENASGSYVLLYGFDTPDWGWMWLCSTFNETPWEGHLSDSYWSFDTTATDTLRVELGSPATETHIMVAHGDQRWSYDGAPGSRSRLEASVGGLEFVEVFPQAAPDAEGQVFVALIGGSPEIREVLEPPPEGEDLPLGTTLTGVTSSATPATYRVDADTAGLLSIAARSDADIFLTLLDQEGAELDRVDSDWAGDSGAEQAAFVVPSAGVFFVRVNNYGVDPAAFTLGSTWLSMPELAPR